MAPMFFDLPHSPRPVTLSLLKSPTSSTRKAISVGNPMSEWISSPDDHRSSNEGAVAAVFSHKDACFLCSEGLDAMKHRGSSSVAMSVYNPATGCNANVFKSYDFEFNLLSDILTPGTSALGFLQASKDSLVCDALVSGPIPCAFGGFLVDKALTRLVPELQETVRVVPRFTRECDKLHGAFAMVWMEAGNLTAVRDRFSYRPLVMGRLDGGGICFASEVGGIHAMNAWYEREVYPGEIISVHPGGQVSSTLFATAEAIHPCLLEYMLIQSSAGNREISTFQRECGKKLAEVAPVTLHPGLVSSSVKPRVVGMPEAAEQARGFSAKAGLTLDMFSLRLRVAGQGIVLVAARYEEEVEAAVEHLARQGPLCLHVRIASPAVILEGCCHKKLVRSEGGITSRMARRIDSLEFLPLEHVKDVARFCHACV